MKKNLPHNIDEFYANRLKYYAEEPGEQVWMNIDKHLPAGKMHKPKRFLYNMAAAMIIVCCTLMPYLIINSTMHLRSATPNTITNKDAVTNNKISQSQPIITKPFLNTFLPQDNNRILQPPTIITNSTNSNSNVEDAHYLSVRRENLVIADMHELNEVSTAKSKIILQPDISKPLTVTLKLHKKNRFSIVPFFSVDHSSGRFIEQYEFDNESEKDFAQREKPDMSFTGGILFEYSLGTKFSLLSGLSLSNAALSISSTAVNALKDDDGVYKFKLGTSYGLAEITKSGITPAAGDSLLISDASLKFKYLSIPVLLNYKLSDKKIKLSVHGGIAFNKITSDKVEVEYIAQNNKETETVNKIEGIRRTFFTINTGLSAGYSIAPKLDIGLSPELHYGINSINKGTPVKTYPVNYGVALSLHLKL